MKKYRYLIIPILWFFFSCKNDIQDVTVQGTVFKAGNNEPINGVDVTVICWKYGNSPDESYGEDETKVVPTDKDGKYKVSFDKGAFVEVKVTLEGYVPGHETREINRKENTIDVVLKQK